MVQENLFEDGGVAISSEREYDFLSRITRISNPHRPGETVLWTSTQYDLLDRPILTTYPDNSTASISYNGSETTVVDPAQKSKRLKYDSLGHVIRVQEDPSR